MNKSEIITLCYKIFIILMIIAQLYLLLVEITSLFTNIISGLLTVYFIFRYYLLIKLSKEATTLNITLNELLKNKASKSVCTCEVCKCEN